MACQTGEGVSACALTQPGPERCSTGDAQNRQHAVQDTTGPHHFLDVHKAEPEPGSCSSTTQARSRLSALPPLPSVCVALHITLDLCIYPFFLQPLILPTDSRMPQSSWIMTSRNFALAFPLPLVFQREATGCLLLSLPWLELSG